MTKVPETDVALKGAEPLVHQHAPEIQAHGHTMLDGGDVQPGARVSFTADGDHDAGRLDAVAGCEFVDDRIRRLE